MKRNISVTKRYENLFIIISKRTLCTRALILSSLLSHRSSLVHVCDAYEERMQWRKKRVVCYRNETQASEVPFFATLTKDQREKVYTCCWRENVLWPSLLVFGCIVLRCIFQPRCTLHTCCTEIKINNSNQKVIMNIMEHCRMVDCVKERLYLSFPCTPNSGICSPSTCTPKWTYGTIFFFVHFFHSILRRFWWRSNLLLDGEMDISFQFIWFKRNDEPLTFCKI